MGVVFIILTSVRNIIQVAEKRTVNNSSCTTDLVLIFLCPHKLQTPPQQRQGMLKMKAAKPSKESRIHLQIRAGAVVTRTHLHDLRGWL